MRGLALRANAVALAAFVLSAPDAVAQDAASALARAQRAYEAFTSITAEFEQTLVNPMLGDPETSTGTIYLTKPDLFAMSFTDPEGDRLVADGTWLWIYTPSTVPNQVIRQPVPVGGAMSPNLFGQFVDRAAERYDTSFRGTETIRGTTVDVVHLVPRGEGNFRWATISVARDSGLMIKLRIREESGQERTLDLVDIRINQRIPERELRFDVPSGTRVITP